MKHALSLTAFGTVIGLLFCFYALPKYKILFIAVALCTGIAALVIYLLNHKSRAEAAMAAVVFISVAVAGIYNVLYTHMRVDAVKELVGQNVQVSGTVVDVYGEGYCRITLSGRINGVKCRMSFYNPEPIEYGSEVTLSALIGEITDLEDMLYSYPDRRYVNLDSVRVQKVEDAKGLAKAFAGIRIYSRNVSQRLVSVCGKESGGILAAMLCGNTSYVDKDIRTDMSRSCSGGFRASRFGDCRIYRHRYEKIWQDNILYLQRSRHGAFRYIFGREDILDTRANYDERSSVFQSAFAGVFRQGVYCSVHNDYVGD